MAKKRFDNGTILWALAMAALIIWGGIAGHMRRVAQEHQHGSQTIRIAQKHQHGNQTIRIAYVSWADAVAITNLAKVVLEDKMGYSKVELTLADPAAVFSAVAKGDRDAFLDAWLPLTHKSFMDKVGDRLDDLGIIYDNAKIGLVVPQYVSIKSITEMNAHKDQFDSRIVGIDSGAGIMKATKKAIQAYHLDFKLIASSDGAMNAALEDAIKHHQWIVVTGWQPHWMFARNPLKFLDDPEHIYGAKPESIHAVVRKGLKKEMPDVAEFLTNMHLDNAQMSDLLNRIEESDDKPDAVCRAWMQDNEKVVDSWLPQKAK